VPGAGWVALRIDVDAELADAVANFLLEEGAPGVITGERAADRPEPPAGRAHVEAHVPAEDEARVLAALRRYLASLAALAPERAPATLETAVVPPVDWIEIARRHHRPQAIGARLLVAPPWEVPAAPGREVLVIEPGMAFGTGQHATTRGCLEAIEEILAAGGVATALDVGTGSGILALALARLGVPRVVALDVDAAVLPLARVNLLRNRAAGVLLVAGTVRALRARFDLVVANLRADALVAEADALAGAVAPGGRLVVSGIFDGQLGAVEAAYPGWRIAAVRAEDAWRTATLVREG